MARLREAVDVDFAGHLDGIDRVQNVEVDAVHVDVAEVDGHVDGIE